MTILLAGEDNRQDETTYQTQEKRSQRCHRWTTFFANIGIDDERYLSVFTDPWVRNLLFCVLAEAMREASYTCKHFVTLAEGTIRSAVDYVAHTFQDHNQPDPRLNEEGKLNYILKQQYKGYKKETRTSHNKKTPGLHPQKTVWKHFHC